MSDSQAQEVLTILRSKLTRAEQVTQLVALINGEPSGDLDELYVNGTRHELREVEAYGLVIGLDAADQATRVYFPAGAFVAGDDA